jgi:hypothetical protein
VEATATPRLVGVAGLPDFSLTDHRVKQAPDGDFASTLFCVAENCGLCGIRMKETYFCTKTKKNQKQSQKSSENRGNEKSKCDLYGLRYSCAGGGFFCSGYRALIGKVLRFFSLKFRSLGRFFGGIHFKLYKYK